jgi:hypothetical protein
LPVGRVCNHFPEWMLAPLIERIGRFTDLMASETDVSLFAALSDAESTGRPLGSDEFVKELERFTGRRLHRQKPGRKPKEHSAQLELGIEAMSNVSS